MKPIYLKMTAFASYCGTAEVDFTKLYDDGIFLITGKTGGGKTTILDAICTALYGKATGSLRGDEWRQLRCIDAPDSRDTEIEYIFSVGDIKYRFYRRWHMPNSRKEDRKLDDKENVCARMTQDSGEWENIATGSAKALKEAAENIIKLTHEQFVKLIMLPQGEFRELLIANDEKKTEIFKKLFDTERWEVLAEEVKNEAKVTGEKCKEQQGIRQFALDSAGCVSPDELDARIKEVSQSLVSLAEEAEKNEAETRSSSEALQKGEAVAKLFNELDARQSEQEKLKSQSAQYEGLRENLAQSRRLRGALSEYKMMNTALNELSRATEALARAEADKAAADEKFSAANENYAGLPALEEAAGRLRVATANLGELAKDGVKHAQAAADLETHTSQQKEEEILIEKLEGEKRSIEERIKNGEEYLSKCMEASQALAGVTQKCNDIGNALALARDYEGKNREFDEVKKAVAQKESEIRRREAELDSQKKSVEVMEEAIRRDKAYSLAAGLEEGAPCPVCGSVHHPTPAEPSDSTPTAKELDTCRKLAERTSKALEVLRKEHSGLTAKQDLLTRDIADMIQKAGGGEIRKSAELSALLAEAEAEKSELTKLAQHTEKTKNKIQAFKTDHETKTFDIKNAETHLNNLRIQINTERQTLASLDERLHSHSIADFDELRKKLSGAEAELNATNSRIKNITDEFNSAKNSLDSAAALLGSARESLTRAESDFKSRRSDFSAKCAELGISENCDFKNGILGDAKEADYEKRLRVYDESLAFAAKRITELTAETDGKTRPDMEALGKAHKAALEAGRDIAERRGKCNQRLELLKNCRETVERADRELKTLELKNSMAQRMSILLSNKNAGKTSIHRYVIGLKMYEVIEQANLYLKRLTSGQYSMRRVEDGAEKNNHALDIEILDGNTGSLRSVSTLSGGEMFLASLALAFGLSETVQSFAGGIHLDSIFIDEGFGSLDSETLDTAMQAITRVRDNRLLGIISHVSDLRERIPAGIEVIKTDNGSSLKIR